MEIARLDRGGVCGGLALVSVRLGALHELEYGHAGTAPRLKFLAADMAIKAVLIAEDDLFFRALVDRPALAGDRIHTSNMQPFARGC